MAEFTASSPVPPLPLDDDGPFEVRSWITAVLLSEPRLFSDDEAEEIAGKFHGTGLDLKTANVGELQATSCLGPVAGMRVHERVDRAQGGLESVFSSLKKTTKAWGWDIIPSNLGSSSPARSRQGSIVPSNGDRSTPRSRAGSQSPSLAEQQSTGRSSSRATSIDLDREDGTDYSTPRKAMAALDANTPNSVRRRSAGGVQDQELL